MTIDSRGFVGECLSEDSDTPRELSLFEVCGIEGFGNTPKPEKVSSTSE
jgi:hypothetical protein